MATRDKENEEQPATSPVNFRVGESFKSYKELEEKIKTYKQSNSVNFGREKLEQLLLPTRELTGT